MEFSGCLVGKAGWIQDVRIDFSFHVLIFYVSVFFEIFTLGFVCICRIQSWKSPMIYFIAVQFSAVVVALLDLHGNKFVLVSWRDSCWGHFSSAVEHLGLQVVHYQYYVCMSIILPLFHFLILYVIG